MTSTKSAPILCALLLALAPRDATAREKPPAEPPSGPVEVSQPVVPTITPAVKDLPDWKPDPTLFGLEMKRRDDFGFIPVHYPITPRVDPLLELQQLGAPGVADAFDAPIHNYAGQVSTTSPPDTTGDVGIANFVQTVNQSVSTAQVLDKSTGAVKKTFTLQSLAASSPCNSGFCDPVVVYDRSADRWLITELPSSGGSVCVYVSTSGDPTGTYYAYAFAVESTLPDYPKYGVWPQSGDAGSYLMGANAGATGYRDVFAFDRAKMLAGLPASFQKFSVPGLPNSGFELVLPSTLQGKTPPPDGEPAIFARPRDDEAQDGASTPAYDLMEMWELKVDWSTPANSTLTQRPSLPITDYDMTLCGLGGTWNCMPQPGTSQKIDPIREPLHYPFVYRNFGEYQTLVGVFAEDVDGTDHAALRWFELRKPAGNSWSLYQEGVVGGEPGVHRSVASIAMDGSGNIAIGYTRTGGSEPYYPSIYYRGRLWTDPLGTMPHGEHAIQDASFSKTNNERWGDYAGIGVDPNDDCTFWFTTEYMSANTTSSTRVAALKFDACGCLSIPGAPTASASAPGDNRIEVGWDDSSTSTIVEYLVYRSTVPGGPYTRIATVADSSPDVANGPPYAYHDDTVSGGTRYYYVVKSTDGVACYSPASNEVDALATGQCRLAPTFAGLSAVTNPGNSTCTLELSWGAGTSSCAGALSYDVYRSTTQGFTPQPENRIATGVSGTAYTDAVGLEFGATYHYVVRAVDTSNGLGEANATRKSAVPTGPITTTSWTDTFEGTLSGGGFDLEGWTHAPIAGTTDWTWSAANVHDGAHSWFARDVDTTSDKVLVSPAFGVGPLTTLSFWHTYRFEGSTTTCFDGATLEYSANGSAWTVVPDADFAAGGFTGTINSSYSNPLAGKRAWCAGTIGTLTQVTVNLGGNPNLLHKSIQVRWHEGDDRSVSSTGWYLDTAAVSNVQVGSSCDTGSGCVAPGAPILTGATGDCAGVNLTWEAGTGSALSYHVYRGTTPGGPYERLSSMPVAGMGYSDTSAAEGATYFYVVTGACEAWGGGESPYGNELSASRWADGTACDDGDACTAGDTCQAGACASGSPVVCTPLDSCHDAGVCDSLTGLCSNPAREDGAACADGDACTAGDACQSGVCVAGAPIPAPAATEGLAFDSASDLSWVAVEGATGYDVVRGTLSTLLGGLTPATDFCSGSRVVGTTLSDTHVPADGDADWFLIRAFNACGTGSYDDPEPSQAAPRDAAIASSPNACP